MTVHLTASEISRNTRFAGSPLATAIDHTAVDRALSHFGQRPFSEADVRAQIASTKARIETGDWDGSCQYDRQTVGQLYADLASFEALAEVIAVHGSEVRRLEDSRPRPPTWGPLGSTTVEVAARVDALGRRGRAAQRLLGVMAREEGAANPTGQAKPTGAAFAAHTLAEWRPHNGATRMRETAAEAQRIKASTEPESLEARRAIGNGSLGLVRQHAEHYLDLFRAIRRAAPALAGEASLRLAAVHEFYATLPSDLSQYLPNDSRWAPFESVSTSLVAKRHHLQERWAALHETLGIPDLVRALRRTAPEALASQPIQRKLERMVVDGLAHLVFDVVLTQEPLDEDLRGIFSHALPPGAPCLLDSASKECKVVVDQVLLVSLFSEIVRNAVDATNRRRMREGTYRSNELAAPLVRVEPQDGFARVTVVDAGDPAEYRAHAVLGGGTTVPGGREGFGIGRLRIRLLAEYLGYDIAHRPLQDGSGSAIEVEIPLG